MPLPGQLPDDQSGKFNRRVVAGNLGGATGVKFGPPSNARWKLYHIQIKLVTTATSGARAILVQLRDTNNNVVREFVNSGTYGTGRAVAATTTERYEVTYFKDGAAQGITLTTTIAAPYVMTNAENIFIKDTAAIDVADQVSAEIEVEEWIET